MVIVVKRFFIFNNCYSIKTNPYEKSILPSFIVSYYILMQERR